MKYYIFVIDLNDIVRLYVLEKGGFYYVGLLILWDLELFKRYMFEDVGKSVFMEIYLVGVYFRMWVVLIYVFRFRFY